MLASKTRNVAAPKSGSDWREAAMNEALLAESRRGKGEEALLRAVRLHRAGCATMSLYPDRRQFQRFLEAHTTDRGSLLHGSSDYESNNARDVYWPYLGWYAVVWEGQALEVVFTPDYYTNGDHLCLGDDAGVVRRFAAAVTDFCDRPAGRCLRYSEGWENAPEIDEELGKVRWEDVVLPPAVLERVREGVEGFFLHREAFSAFGFPWKRGILLIGPPGTGKTMLCKAAAAAMSHLPFLYVRDLREDDKKDAIEAIFRRARKLAPCILAFEDIDGFINAQNRTMFLNEMDGFDSNEGLLVIASSNHPGKIDEALLKRPSRFDRVLHIGLPGPEERRAYCRRLLFRGALAARRSPDLDVEALAVQVAERSDKFTPAYLKEAFIAAALQRAQAGVTALDACYAEAVLEQVEELRGHLKRSRDLSALVEMSGAGTIGFR